MRTKLLFVLAVLGLLGGLVSAYVHSIRKKPEPPVFTPTANPYPKGIYANGIVESDQGNGENVNIYPEVPGTVVKIAVTEGQSVHRGDTLLVLDDTVQRATTAQQAAQASAALALLNELKAQPRKETLAVAQAQVESARASLASLEQQYEKQRRSFELESRSVSRDVLDTAGNAVKVARANLAVAQRQLELTRAGAWTYDIQNQQRQYEAFKSAEAASSALLDKYTIKAPVDGVVLTIGASVGGYVSAQGAYLSYTGAFGPAIVMGSAQATMGVRCYIDEILVHRLPAPKDIQAKLFIRGTQVSIPLQFVRVQPYVSPKIALSDQKAERVDVRVLPVIFRFDKPKDVPIYPGQLVDVYLAQP